MCSIKKNFAFILIVGSSFFISNGYGQNPDSLTKILSTKNLSSSEYLRICDDLSWEYLNYDFEKAKKYAELGIEKAKADNNQLMEVKLYRNLGVAYYMNSQMDTALLFLNKSLKKALELKAPEQEAAIYGAIGNVHNVSGNYQDALTYYLKALSMFEKQGNKERIRSLLGNIATLYYSLINLVQAEKYYSELEKLSLEANDLYNIGRAYEGFSKIAFKRKDFDTSLLYSKKAADIFSKGGYKSSEAIALQGIAMVYYMDYKDYAKAREYAVKALEITKELGYKSDIAGSLNILSNIYFNEKDYAGSLKAAREAIENDTTDANVTSNLYANMVRAGIFSNNPKETLFYFDKYRNLIDKRSTKEFEQALAEMEKKYQTQKKEMRIDTLEKERILYGAIFIIGIVVLLLFLLVLYLRNRTVKIGKKLADQKIIQLEQAQQLIATQAVLDGETAERTRLARDLHDGLGGMLSAVKLNLFDIKQGATIEAEDVSRFNKVMEMLDKSMQELRRVAHNMMPESLSRYGLKVALEDFCNSFSHVHFHFFGEEKRINQKAETTLYRAVFELVNNATKHAQAKSINVQIVQYPDNISVNVQDDGVGFDPQAESKGTGLQNIKNRINSIGGKMNILSSREAGTEIIIDINFNQIKDGEN